MDSMAKYKHDTHLHLDLLESKSKTILQIEKNKSYTIAVTNLPPLYEKLNKEINSKYIRIALGFHPDLINQYKKYIPEMWKHLKHARYIGEVGLDSKNKSNKEFKEQIDFFEKLIDKCNIFGNKILSVHSRGSENTVLSVIGNNFNGKIILHWYSGTIKNLEKAIDNGFYFSVNKAMLQSINGLKIIKRIPLNRLLIESDAPFIKHNDYLRDLQLTVENLAAVKELDIGEIENILSNNFEKMLRI